MNDKEKLCVGITGSTGFLGSAVLNYFRECSHTVILLDDLVHPSHKRKNSKVPALLDWVLHFGASRSIESSFENPVSMYRNNMHSTMVALDIALSRKSRFLYMSSYVYGRPHNLPIDESHATFALNPYMGSKLLGEQMCLQLHQSIGFSVLILRGFTFFGPNQKGNQLIPSIIESICKNKPIIVNDPNPKRDYLYIDDFTRLLNIIVQSDFSGYDIYNLGGGKPYKNIDVAQMANDLVGNNVPIYIEEYRRRNDVSECYANIEKVSRDFEWFPEIDLRSGLRKYF